MTASRRQFLGYVATAAAAAGAGVVGGRASADTAAPVQQPVQEPARVQPHSPHGEHQAGVLAPQQPVTHAVALDLLPETGAPELARLLRAWSGDVEALMTGEGPLGDPTPELAEGGNSLTVTVGLGHAAFELPGLRGRRPAGLSVVPPMRHDRLEARWSGGDLLLLVAAQEATSVDHAVRRLVRDAEPFARLRWRQRGSWRGTDADGRPVTGRNLFGQVDGTGNPPPGALLDQTVWAQEPDWFVGGTTVVVRRIRMDLDEWDRLTRDEQDAALGRRLADGAPVHGRHEREPVDLRRLRPDAHVAVAHPSANGFRRIFRKGANWTDERVTSEGVVTESGLLFLSFQADVARQLVPVQQHLDRADALNRWTTAVGSAEFAVLPGFRPGGWLGEGLFRA